VTPSILGLVVALIVAVVLFEMLRRHRLREKYALVWFFVAVGLIVVTVFPGVLIAAAELLHVQVPANLLFFLGSLMLLAMSLQHSFELGRLEERTRTLAEEVALLRLSLEQVQAPAPEDPASEQPGTEPAEHREPGSSSS
jgi:hypothetical protein